jgi:hypothetical protein
MQLFASPSARLENPPSAQKITDLSVSIDKRSILDKLLKEIKILIM